jgi:hypothetical protein
MKQENCLEPSDNIQLPIKNGKLRNMHPDCGTQLGTEDEPVIYPGRNSTCVRVF